MTDSHSVHFSASEQARIRECIQALRVSYATFMREAVLSLVESCEGATRQRPAVRRYFQAIEEREREEAQ